MKLEGRSSSGSDLLFENTMSKGFIAMFNDYFYQTRKPLNSEILENRKPSFCHTCAVVSCSSKSPGSECSTQREQNKASQRSVSNEQQFSQICSHAMVTN